MTYSKWYDFGRESHRHGIGAEHPSRYCQTLLGADTLKYYSRCSTWTTSPKIDMLGMLELIHADIVDIIENLQLSPAAPDVEGADRAGSTPGCGRRCAHQRHRWIRGG